MRILFGKYLAHATFFSVISFLCCEISGQRALIKEGNEQILTYPYSDPNPVPVLAINSTVSPYYPYFVFDGYTDKGLSKEWKVITLENDYILVPILPGVGGKVWGAIEKSTGGEFIYLNHVLKFRALGIRGPWTSGGIEHNFGLDLGHAPWTSSMVDYVTKENPDGSVSCIVGGLDLASRTQWRVNILLPKDKAYFETRSMWYNPTPLHDAYLSYENAAFKVTDDLEFCFPGIYYIDHDGTVESWPFDQNGHNLSMYKENNFGTDRSYHVSGLFTEWFGGYLHKSDFGFGHYVPYTDAPGKKIWRWSLARDGAIWEDLLTDSDGQYIEAQSGVKFNQANRASGFNSPYNQLTIRPHYTETKTDYWFPVKNTHGMLDASPAGTLNIILSKDSLKIYISPNSSIVDSLEVTVDGKRFYSEYVRLKPMIAFQKLIPFPHEDGQNFRVSLGKNLLFYSSDSEYYKTDRPTKSAENQNYNSTEHLFRLAEDENAMRNYPVALEYYLACLQKEPTHSKALCKVAELYYRRAKYTEGLEFARKVLEDDTYNAGANFISGVIHKKLGNMIQAEEYFSVAARSLEYRSGSFLEIASIRMHEQDFSHAVEYAEKALDYNRFNIPAYELLATSYRQLNKVQESEKTLKVLLDLDPLNHYARFEKYMLNPGEESLQMFNSAIRNELPHETYLELALEYANIGLDNEAIKVLEQSPPYPTVFYWLAYLNRNSSRDKSMEYLKKAEEMSPCLVFPYRLETLPVLSWALSLHYSWKTSYYLGLIYWHILRIEKARELFEQCGDIPDYAPFYIARAILFQNDLSEYCHPCNDLPKAVKLNPEEWRTWHYLNNFLLVSGTLKKHLENAKQAFNRFRNNPVIDMDYVKALINSGNFRESLKILDGVLILPQEGAHEGHDLFELSNLAVAVELIEKKKYKEAVKYINNSENWPENLGAGKPYEPDTRLQDFMSAYCYKQLGDRKMADDHFNQIISYSNEHWGNPREPTNTLISMLVFNDQGKNRELINAMYHWKAEQDSLRNWRISNGSASPKVQWVFAKQNNDREKATILEKEIAADANEYRFRLLLKTLSVINFNFKENEK
jgi:tetratricopeptide (TPR) repeat protein